MTIKGKMIALAAVSAILTALVTAISWYGTGQIRAVVAKKDTAVSALKNQSDTDMMHDALRADVLASLYYASDPSKKQEILDGLKEHSGGHRGKTRAECKIIASYKSCCGSS